jgi:flavin-dependent dehydrogenase
MAGLRTVVLERAIFPREKVCGDCLNPKCWPVLERLAVADKVRAAPHGKLSEVNFIDLRGRRIGVALPAGEEAEIAIPRRLFDQILLERARSLGAEVRESETVVAIDPGNGWTIQTANCRLAARVLVAADGRNSTVARLCNLMPRSSPNRIALQSHVPLPVDYGDRIVLQLVAEGYCGQAPVGEGLLNLCLVSRPRDMPAIKAWAEKEFSISADHSWRTITPLARSALPVVRPDLFLVGDAARVVEPFTGEGIYYALRSGELAASAIRSADPSHYARAHRRLYAGRLWINSLARYAVQHPRLATTLLRVVPNEKRVLGLLTSKVVRA